MSPEDALLSLVSADLGSGGVPSGLRHGPDGVTIQVETLDHNIVEFIGCYQEMELLVEVVRIWRGLKSDNAFFGTKYAELLQEHGIAKLIYLILLEVKCDDDAECFARLEITELHTLVCLSQDKLSYEKLLALTA